MRHLRYEGIVIASALNRCMPHTLAEIEKLVVKTKTIVHPTVDVFNGVMMPQCICSCVGTVDCLINLSSLRGTHDLPFTLKAYQEVTPGFYNHSN